MSITKAETRVKIAEIAADILKQHIQSKPEHYKYDSDVPKSFVKLYEEISKKVNTEE